MTVSRTAAAAIIDEALARGDESVAREWQAWLNGQREHDKDRARRRRNQAPTANATAQKRPRPTAAMARARLLKQGIEQQDLWVMQYTARSQETKKPWVREYFLTQAERALARRRKYQREIDLLVQRSRGEIQHGKI